MRESADLGGEPVQIGRFEEASRATGVSWWWLHASRRREGRTHTSKIGEFPWFLHLGLTHKAPPLAFLSAASLASQAPPFAVYSRLALITRCSQRSPGHVIFPGRPPVATTAEYEAVGYNDTVTTVENVPNDGKSCGWSRVIRLERTLGNGYRQVLCRIGGRFPDGGWPGCSG